MTQLNDEHLELHSQNKAERYERQKIKYLEDRIATMEKSLGSIHKILGRFQMTEATGFEDVEQQLHDKGLAVVGKDIDHELI